MHRRGAIHISLRVQVTNSIDVYSLGFLLWELVSGQTAWEGLEESQIIVQVGAGGVAGCGVGGASDAAAPATSRSFSHLLH